MIIPHEIYTIFTLKLDFREYQIFSKRTAETKTVGPRRSNSARTTSKKEKAQAEEPNGRSRRGGWASRRKLVHNIWSPREHKILQLQN